jgi:hypothetical protein
MIGFSNNWKGVAMQGSIYDNHPLLDTAHACIERQESVYLYIGGGKPHFPLPAVKPRPAWVIVFQDCSINGHFAKIGREVYNVGE